MNFNKTLTVVLNVYGRPQHLDEQFNSIINQTIKPTKIIIWNNGCTSFDFSKFKKHELVSFYDSSHNFGVWSRIFIGLYSDTDYVCVFDDDTIPGKKWFENCFNTLQEVDGALGTVGVVNVVGNKYKHIKRVGWVNPNEVIEEVDTIGHSIFLKREHLSVYVNDLPDLVKYKIFGEDMHITYTLQKFKNLKTFVPPHPKNDQDMWGSHPVKGWKYGTENVAISVRMNFNNFSTPYQRICELGFESMSNRDQHIKNRDNVLNYFINKITNRQPFSLINLNTEEYKILNDENHRLKFYLKDILKMYHSNNYTGINYEEHEEKIFFQKNIFNQANLTFSNIFKDANKEIFFNFLKKNNLSYILISNNDNSKLKFYDKLIFNENTDLLEENIIIAKNIAKKYSQKIFLLTEHTFSKILIYQMYVENPNNIYLDVGTLFD